MKVLLLKDVYKLGRAGDVKKVAAGYGRNYLIPQGLAIMATADAVKMSERIKVTADKERAVLNKELSGIAEQINGMVLTFAARASETGRLYGSVNNNMIAEVIQSQLNVELSARQIEAQPLRELGEYTVPVRLTVDLIPEVKVIVYREGEAPPSLDEEAAEAEAEAKAAAEAAAEAGTEVQVEAVEHSLAVTEAVVELEAELEETEIEEEEQIKEEEQSEA